MKDNGNNYIHNDRTKTKPTPKQNKYKNPEYARKMFSYLSKGMSQLKAGLIISSRIKG